MASGKGRAARCCRSIPRQQLKSITVPETAAGPLSPWALRVSPQPIAFKKLADSYIDAQEGALLAQDAIAEWLDRYRLELDSETQVIYESMEALKRADLVELK